MNVPRAPEERKTEILDELRALIDAEQRRSGNPWHACLGTRLAVFDLQLSFLATRPSRYGGEI